MAKRKVEVELSRAAELGLMDRYGRRHHPESLVKKAIAGAATTSRQRSDLYDDRKSI